MDEMEECEYCGRTIEDGWCDTCNYENYYGEYEDDLLYGSDDDA